MAICPIDTLAPGSIRLRWFGWWSGGNPFYTYLLWAPTGYDLAAWTIIPLPGIVAFPLTHFLGPTAAYNLLMLASPPLAAWTGFLLFRRLRISEWPALFSGYLFGFSPYMLSHLLGHVNLVWVLFVPLATMLALRWLARDLSTGRFIFVMGLILTGQALCSLEIFATGTLIGGIALAIAFALGCLGIRRRFSEAVLVFASSYAVAALLLSPYLFYFFDSGAPALDGAARVAAQPLNILIPPSTTLIGHIHSIFRFTRGINPYEISEFVGFPILAIFLSFTMSRWAEGATRFLVYMLAIIWVLSLGTYLLIDNHPIVDPMPWHLLSQLPLLGDVTPERLCLFSFLILAIIVGFWLNDNSKSTIVRATGTALVLIFFVPNLSAEFWTKPLDTPPFFTTEIYKHYISPNDNVVILPYSFRGNADVWQANSRMYFRMAGGYAGWAPAVPTDFQEFPIVQTLQQISVIPDATLQLKVFIARNDVRALIIADQGKHLSYSPANVGRPDFDLREFSPRELSLLRDLLSTLEIEPIRIGGVSLYMIPPDRLARYRKIDPREMERTICEKRLNALAAAAQLYTLGKYQLSELSPLRVQQLGLLPANWVTSGSVHDSLADGLLLMPVGTDRIALGMVAPKVVLEPILLRSKRDADKVILLPPLTPSGDPLRTCEWLVVFQYRIARLADVIADTGNRASGS